MQCRECQEVIDNLLIAEPTEKQRFELAEHLEQCPDCARQYALAQEALAEITPLLALRASTNFKERVMSAISTASVIQPKPVAYQLFTTRRLKLAAAIAAAAVLLIILTPLLPFGPKNAGHKPLSAFGLLAEASAAEAKLFSGTEIVHLLSRIIVTPVADAELAKIRWFPLVSLQANGKPRYSQLSLAAEPGKGYTIEDNSWYDPTTGRFLRILLKDGKPIFANSFDGRNIYSLEIPAGGMAKVAKKPITKDFQPPKTPAEFLGIAAGLKSAIDAQDQSLVRDAGKVKLEDGAEARVVRAGFPEGGPKETEDNYWLFTIREDNNTIEKMEWRLKGQSLLVVRRGETETGQEPVSGWDLAGVATQAGAAAAQAGPAIRPDMVIADVSIADMLKKADFPVYVFDKDPTWAGDRKITDILDIVSPPQRMFAITYKAKDHRHVVLLQSPSYNKMFAPLIKMGKLVYTSPSGIKVLSGPQDQWLAKILLQSARATIQEPPVAEPTGYLLETPEGTFPTLAVNGKISDEELHALIDSLVPAKSLVK
jgi:hypothetical protein